MKDFIELIEFFFESLKLPSRLSQPTYIFLTALGIIIAVITALSKIYNYLNIINNRKLLNKNLGPNFSEVDIYNHTRFYIPTKYQTSSTALIENSDLHNNQIRRKKLIPILLKELIEKKIPSNKYFLILADSGMGKTTLLINLAIKIQKRINRSWLRKQRKVALIPMGSSSCDQLISEISDKENTILLLDAFDEDLNANENYNTRLKEILQTSWRFKSIVISCRTQFFPSSYEEPYETGFFSFGDQGEYIFQKYYIAPFSKFDVIKFLNKRYPLINPLNTKKFIKAYRIVSKCKNLLIRPMLLNYINELVNTKKIFNFTFEIYHELIDRWIIRESKKSSIKSKYKSSEDYANLLWSFSKELATICSKIKN